METMDWKQVLEGLRVPFAAEIVSWKPQMVSRDKKRCLAVPYVDTQAYQHRLDQVCPEWQDDYAIWFSDPQDMVGRGGEKRVISGKVFVKCRLTIADHTRSDVGECELTDENALTTAKAQAYKRACAAFGLGRYLYDLPKPWVDFDEDKGIPEAELRRLEGLLRRHASSNGANNGLGGPNAANGANGVDGAHGVTRPEAGPAPASRYGAPPAQPVQRGAPAAAGTPSDPRATPRFDTQAALRGEQSGHGANGARAWGMGSQPAARTMPATPTTRNTPPVVPAGHPENSPSERDEASIPSETGAVTTPVVAVATAPGATPSEPARGERREDDAVAAVEAQAETPAPEPAAGGSRPTVTKAATRKKAAAPAAPQPVSDTGARGAESANAAPDARPGAGAAPATSAGKDEETLCPIHHVPLQLVITREGKTLLLHRIEGEGYCNGQEVRQVTRV